MFRIHWGENWQQSHHTKTKLALGCKSIGNCNADHCPMRWMARWQARKSRNTFEYTIICVCNIGNLIWIDASHFSVGSTYIVCEIGRSDTWTHKFSIHHVQMASYSELINVFKKTTDHHSGGKHYVNRHPWNPHVATSARIHFSSHILSLVRIPVERVKWRAFSHILNSNFSHTLVKLSKNSSKLAPEKAKFYPLYLTSAAYLGEDGWQNTMYIAP